jgi:hypothetical protein
MLFNTTKPKTVTWLHLARVRPQGLRCTDCSVYFTNTDFHHTLVRKLCGFNFNISLSLIHEYLILIPMFASLRNSFNPLSVCMLALRFDVFLDSNTRKSPSTLQLQCCVHSCIPAAPRGTSNAKHRRVWLGQSSPVHLTHLLWCNIKPRNNVLTRIRSDNLNSGLSALRCMRAWSPATCYKKYIIYQN